MLIKFFKTLSIFVLGIIFFLPSYADTQVCSVEARCDGIGVCGGACPYGNCISDSSCQGCPNICMDGSVPIPPLCECGGMVEFCEDVSQYRDSDGICKDCPSLPADAQNCMVVGLGANSITGCRLMLGDLANPCIMSDSTGIFEINGDCPYSQS